MTDKQTSALSVTDTQRNYQNKIYGKIMTKQEKENLLEEIESIILETVDLLIQNDSVELKDTDLAAKKIYALVRKYFA